MLMDAVPDRPSSRLNRDRCIFFQSSFSGLLFPLFLFSPGKIYREDLTFKFLFIRTLHCREDIILYSFKDYTIPNMSAYRAKVAMDSPEIRSREATPQYDQGDKVVCSAE
jgi:hypothetical protein